MAWFDRCSRDRTPFAPYVAETGGLDEREVEAWTKAINESYRSLGLLNSFDTYVRVIDRLLEIDTIRLKPLRALAEPQDADGHACIYLRHDCDSDLPTTLRAARFLNARGVQGTFFLLHTSGYYGNFASGKFIRNRAMASAVRTLAGLGQEVGLHHDPLHVYLTHRIDGIAAMRSELGFLRACGARIDGVVAHNSALAYGAENFEIFAGLSVDGRRELIGDTTTVPLGRHQIRDFDLQYEGNFVRPPCAAARACEAEFLAYRPPDALRDRTWLEYYFLKNPFFDRSYDRSVWVVGRDLWAVAYHPQSGPRRLELMTTDELLHRAADFEPDAATVLVVHPEYVAGP